LKFTNVLALSVAEVALLMNVTGWSVPASLKVAIVIGEAHAPAPSSANAGMTAAKKRIIFLSSIG
jgi:hypothetical protein